MVAKRKHPKFFRMNFGRKDRKRIGHQWRKPRGIDNKKRVKLKYVGADVNIGWRNPKALRGVHPSGMREVLVSNISQLEKARGKAARIAGSVGARKRNGILKKAAELGIHVVNR